VLVGTGPAPRALLFARPPRRFVPGSVGTLEHAIAEQERRRRKRPQTEGTLPERRLEGTCPPEMSNVDARFCIDRWEASVVDEAGTPWPPTHALATGRRFRAVSQPNVIPQGYIGGDQAAAACRASGKRLCEAVEWRFACGGSDGSTYPYGPRRVEGRCNDHGRSPMFVFYPDVARSWSLVSNADMNDPRLNELSDTVARTGEHGGCVNDWGLYDMVGNLHEWTADPHGTFQGGYYLDTQANGEGCAYRTTAHDLDYHDYSTGFRCCADLASEDE